MRPDQLPAPGAPMPKASDAPTSRPWPDDPSPYAAARPPAAPVTGATAAPATPPQPAAPAPAAAPTDGGDAPPLVDRVIEALRTCYDPEIPLNIYDLSLIYGIDVDPAGNVTIQMTLTSPTCPVAGTLPGEVQNKVAMVPGVTSAQVDLVWDPPWDVSMLSEAARLTLGLG